MRITSLLVVLLMSGMLYAPPASTTVITGRSSTVLEWYDTPEEETAVPAYEYLQIKARDIAGSNLRAYGYGRIADDLAGEDDDVNSRLYAAYLDGKVDRLNLDFRFGRQFISTIAGASVMDGARLKFNNLLERPLAFSLFGGGDVKYSDTYKYGDWVVGGELRYGGRYDTGIGLSYLQKWEEGAAGDGNDLAFEMLGLDLRREFNRALQAYGELQFDLLTESVSHGLVGADYHRAVDWSVRAEYLYSLPVFSSTSIYSVFAVSEYEEIMVEYNRYIDYDLKAFGRVTYEMYVDYDDAQLFELGARKMMMRSPWGGYLVVTFRDDEDGQDLYGVKLHGARRITSTLQLGLGAHVDVLERRLEPDADETTSSRVWADASYRLNKRTTVEGKLEYLESDLWDYQLRGRVRLNWTF